MQYAIVQHSGYGYKGNRQFIGGLESRSVSAVEARRVEKAGGLVFESYGAAEDFAEQAMYPEGYGGLIPNAKGSFSRVAIDGLAVYIPVREVVG
ncbi:MAG: hypothetical protein NVS3B1_17710 [Marmoricola sp.]